MSVLKRIREKILRWTADKGKEHTEAIDTPLGSFISVPSTTCPVCKHTLNMATKRQGKNPTPQPRDIGVCHMCGGILEIGTDLQLTPISDLAWAKLPSSAKEYVMRIAKLAIKAPREKQEEKEGELPEWL